MQDAFVRACDALTSKYGEERCRALAVRPWLFRIVRNLSLNRRRRRRTVGERLKEVPGLSEAPSAEKRLHDQERSAALARLLESLPVEVRELIALRFVEELSYADISRVLKLSEAALRARTFRAVQRLKKAPERGEK